MDDLLVPGADVMVPGTDTMVPGTDMDMEFIEKNPEAIFDFITIKNIQERYGKMEPPRHSSRDTYRKNEAVYQNEIEFETFVQQFPIDDSIAECFATTNGSLPTKPEEQFVSDALEPAMRLSLKLQKPEITLSESLFWVDSTLELLTEKKEKTCEALNQLLVTGNYEGVVLKGATPTMVYADNVLQGFIDAIKQRFQTESCSVVNATKILNFGSWPMSGSPEMKDFGNDAVKLVFQHFERSMTRVNSNISIEGVTTEWSLLKKLVTKKYGDISTVTWETVFRETTDVGQIMLLIDLMLTIPSTSVTCETTFSQMKLLKTCRRSRLGNLMLNDLMTVKLESADITEFQPDSAINNWLGGKRPQISTKYSKLKKKFGWKGADDSSLLSEEEGRSRDSKRSKKGRGVFSKRHKWRNFGHGALSSSSKKSVNFSDNSEKSGSENTSDLAGTGRHFGSHDLRDSTRSDDVVLTDSFSISDSQITSFSETLGQSMDQTVPAHYERIPTHLPMHHMRSLDSNIYKSTHRQTSPTHKHHADTNDTIAGILAGDSGDIIQRIEDMPPTEVLIIRDRHGNSLLHRSVLQGCSDVIKYILEKLPEMASEMNTENETAIELAARHGKYDCLKVILERNQRRKSLGVSLVNRLLNVCAQYGQAECIILILSYMSRDVHGTCTLPGDTRGNTAAHLAAKHGHLHCLQALVAAGCDVMSENLMQQRPLHVAHQSRSQGCFEYLLLLNICEELLTSLRTQVQINMRLNEQMSSVKPSLEHIRLCLGRYRDLCSETSQLLTENKVSILETLNNLQEELKRFIQHTSMDTATKRKEARQKIEELRAEVEQLEDIFEFSPLSELDAALSKLISPLDDVIGNHGNHGEDSKLGDYEALTREENCSILSSLIRDIHKESMLENWETSGIYSKYLKRDEASGSMDDLQSPTATDGNSPTTYLTHADITQQDDDELSGSENTEYANINHALTGTVNLENDSEDEADDDDIGAGRVREKLPTFLDKLHTKQEEKENTKQDESFEDNSNARKLNNNELLKRLEDMTAFEGNGDRLDTYDDRFVTSGGQLDAHDGDVGQFDDNGAPLDGYQLKDLNVNFNESDKDKSTSDIEDTEGTKCGNPTERPFTKLLSLDERIDLLIAGEREREKSSDTDRGQSSSESKDSNGVGSIYASTFTSITSDTSGTSDWYSKHGFPSLETTSSDDVTYDITSDTTPSYWWDIGDHRDSVESREFRRSMPYGNDIKRKIHLNLENDGSSYNELREHRLNSHLRSMHQSRYPSNHYRERITTSTGEIIGGFHKSTDERVLVDVNTALRERKFHQPIPKPRKRENTLFTLDDAIATKPMSESEFRDRYDRSHGSGGQPNLRWEDMSITDDEDRGSLTWSRDIESSGSQTPQSYV